MMPPSVKEMLTPHDPAVMPSHIDVLVATKDDILPNGLDYLGMEFDVVTSTLPGWATAANAVLDDSVRDALFLDDDISLTPWSLALLRQCYAQADVFGFTLLHPTPGGLKVVSNGYVINNNGDLVPVPLEYAHLPWYLAHVTASCFYLKRKVIEAGIRFPLWPGTHSEDVAFTLDCWLHGFKVAYLPGAVYHHLGGDGTGATVSQQDNLGKKLATNKLMLREWMAEHHIAQAVADGVVPLGAVPFD